jgi:hypothetical protein
MTSVFFTGNFFESLCLRITIIEFGMEPDGVNDLSNSFLPLPELAGASAKLGIYH